MSKHGLSIACRRSASTMIAGAISAAGFIIVLGSAAPAHTPETASAEAANVEQGDVKLSLRRLQEMRRIDVIEPEEGVFDHHKPGLVLTYDLEVPDGMKIYGVEQPESMDATDDTGKDLSDIEPDFGGERTYAELIPQWEQPPSGLQFHLLPSARGAEMFSLNATFHINAYGGTEAITVEPTQQWTNMDAALFPVDQLEVRMQQGGFDGQSAEVSLRPGTARDAIEKVYLIDGNQEIESTGSMWSDRFATFSFQHQYRDGQQVRFVVRTDVQSIPVTIELEEHDLP